METGPNTHIRSNVPIERFSTVTADTQRIIDRTGSFRPNVSSGISVCLAGISVTDRG